MSDNSTPAHEGTIVYVTVQVRCSECEEIFDETLLAEEVDDLYEPDEDEDGVYSYDDAICKRCAERDMMDVTRDWTR